MDRMYTIQRHIYDLTRKYYLLGRDRLLRGMELRDGDRVLEVGCGTARNLIILARRLPTVRLYGLDASAEMLATAEAKARRAGLGGRIRLEACLAEELDHQNTFGLDVPFDAAFLSYSLSMIPPWREALQATLAGLTPGGSLYVVDFCDLAALPRWFRRLLTGWLDLFHVHFLPEHVNHLRMLEAEGRGSLDIEYLAGRYAYLAHFRKARPQESEVRLDAISLAGPSGPGSGGSAGSPSPLQPDLSL